MEEQPYVSCIKINGVPILPPLMTDDVRTEMNYYKQLAIAVEERLKILEIASLAESEKKIVHKKQQNYDFTNENSAATETETSTVESTPNINTVIDIPTKENDQDTLLPSLDNTVCESVTETFYQSPNSRYDYENKQGGVASSTCSDTITASTDLNQYLKFSPEIVKPQVPKTLNVIPITVDVPKKVKDKEKEESGGETERADTPPKLIRQGSYILESPSPMLLAHMQTELANPEYIPTSTNMAPKRKEWNISEAKSEWENQHKNKELIIPVENPRNNFTQGRYRRNSLSTVNNQKLFKSLTNSKNSSCSLGRSVDCIQTMIDKELLCKSPSRGRGNNKNNYSKDNNPQNRRSNRNVSILNLANRLGGSTGSLNHFPGQFVKNIQPKASIIEDKRSSPSPSKSVAVSEKLMIIFKEIQRKHEEQMTELIAKQQREQKNMQKEFEEQQVLLLGQIKKTFPGISILQTSETVSDIPIENSTTEIENGDVYSSDNNDPPPVVAKCPLDYIYPLNTDCNILSCKNIETPEDEFLNGDKFDSENMKILDKSTDRYSNVSRQLFPLDSNTVHVPVPVNVLYSEKQIRAATIINAFARGYLVRRLMKTERVISLKTTYKEALHCMLKLHVDAPLNLPELNFHQRLQLQCDAASMNIAELFAQGPKEKMQVITQDREIKRSRAERPSSAHSYSFATQRTLARKKMKEMGDYSSPPISRPCSARSRCQTWTSNSREKRSQNIYHGIKRSTSAGTVRKPWR